MTYISIYEALEAISPESLNALTEDERYALDHVDDFEPIKIVYDGYLVSGIDMISGDCIGSLTVEEFIAQTLELVREEV